MDHGGSWGGYRAQLLRFPEQHFSVVCLCNLGNANPEKRAHRVADVYLGKIMKEPPPAEEADSGQQKGKETTALTNEQIASFAGEFSSEELRATYTIGVADGKLLLRKIQIGDGFLTSTKNLVLRPVSQDTFVVDDEGLDLGRHEENRPEMP